MPIGADTVNPSRWRTAGETYFPESMGEREYYQPVDRGLEARIKEKLDHLRELNLTGKNKAEK